MYKNILLLFIAVFFFAGNITAQIIDDNDAQHVAEVWLQDIVGAKENVELQHVVTVCDDVHKTNYYSVFNDYDNNSFVIVAGDERILPILGYSTEGVFVNDNIPENFADWMQGVVNEMNAIFESPQSLKVHPEWNILLNGNYQPKGITNVSPLVQSQWDQGCNYNAYCPADYGGPCGHVYTGCVATAMAMVMKYWNYPEHGLGQSSYTHQNYGRLSAIYGETTYNWNSMPNFVYSQNSAVATLMSHCGISVEMNYSPSGSGANTRKVAFALRDYFGYSDEIQYNERVDFKYNNWIQMLKAELDASRPMEYSGHGTAGHAFVCDGYDSNDMFHFNWGWSGSQNGYFTVSNLNPGGYTFNNNQTVVANVIPDPSKFCNPPLNLSANIDGCNVSISWDTPIEDTIDLTGFQISCNGEVVDTVTSTHYSGEYGFGDFVFCVQAMYNNGCVSDGIVCVNVTGTSHFPVRDLTTSSEGELVILTWEAPYHTASYDHFDIFRDGAKLLSTNDFSFKELLQNGSYNYCVTVVYEDRNSSEPSCLNVEVDEQCLNPVNLEVDNIHGGNYLSWDDDEASFPISYDVYKNDILVAESTVLKHYFDKDIETADTYGVRSNYNFCESGIATIKAVEGFEDVVDDVLVYPNPTDRFIMIEGGNMLKIEIYNSLGQVMGSFSVDNNSVTIDCADYQSGIYFARIFTAAKVQQVKFVIAK